MIQTRPNELRPDEPAAGRPGNDPQDRLKQHAGDVKRQADDVRQATGEAVQQAGEKLRNAGRQAKDQVVQTARQATSQAGERASNVLAAQKTRLADEVSVFAEALHKAGDTLDERNDQAIGRYVHQAADCIDSCVNYLRERDTSEMVRGIGGFTRRHPEVVLGGLFLAGVAAARFLKASDRNRSGEFGGDRDYGYMDTGRGLESGAVYDYGGPSNYDDQGYGDIGMYAGGEGQLASIGRRDDLDTIDEITGLAPISRENRGQSGNAGAVPSLPREEPSLTRNTDLPSSTAPQPGSYPPVTASGTFFESTSGQTGKTNPSSNKPTSSR